MVREIA